MPMPRTPKAMATTRRSVIPPRGLHAFGCASQNSGGALDASGNATNALAAYLNASNDPSQQVQAANALLGQTLGAANPYFQSAVSRYAKDLGSDYQGAIARGQGTDYKSYIDYINKATPLGSWV